MTIIIIQARTSSSRLPGKMLEDLGGMPLFEFVCRRCLTAKFADEVVLATSDDPSDDKLAELAEERGFNVFRGSLENVLDRFVKCANSYSADIVVRLCGDSPLVDMKLMEKLCKYREREKLDYAAPEKGTFIPAFDSEVVTSSALKRIHKLAEDNRHFEHVTLLARENPQLFKIGFLNSGLKIPAKLAGCKLTVDTIEDLKLNRKIITALPPHELKAFSFTSGNIINLLSEGRAGEKGRAGEEGRAGSPSQPKDGGVGDTALPAARAKDGAFGESALPAARAKDGAFGENALPDNKN